MRQGRVGQRFDLLTHPVLPLGHLFRTCKPLDDLFDLIKIIFFQKSVHESLQSDHTLPFQNNTLLATHIHSSPEICHHSPTPHALSFTFTLAYSVSAEQKVHSLLVKFGMQFACHLFQKAYQTFPIRAQLSSSPNIDSVLKPVIALSTLYCQSPYLMSEIF